MINVPDKQVKKPEQQNYAPVDPTSLHSASFPEALFKLPLRRGEPYKVQVGLVEVNVEWPARNSAEVIKA